MKRSQGVLFEFSNKIHNTLNNHDFVTKEERMVLDTSFVM